MKVLSILNLSNREGWGCDSGVIFHRLLFSRLEQCGWQCKIASPVELAIPRVQDIPFEVGSSKYDVRFRFNWDAFADLVTSNKPDILFVHQVELTSSVRALLVTLNLAPKLVTYCHYWPILRFDEGEIEWDSSLNHSGLAELILLRILSAARSSDHFFVTSSFAKSLLSRAAERYRFNIDQRKVHILPCPSDPAFLVDSPRVYRGSKKVLYNHRLYKQYGTDFFIDIASHFVKSGLTFVVTDFFSDRSHTRRLLDPSIDEYRLLLSEIPNVSVHADGDTRSNYRRLMDDIDIAMAPYRINANWSMSAVDCLGMGIPTIGPNVASFPEFIPKTLLFNSKAEAITLIERLFCDSTFWRDCSARGQQIAKAFSADTAASAFMQIVGL